MFFLKLTETALTWRVVNTNQCYIFLSEIIIIIIIVLKFFIWLLYFFINS